MILSGGIFLILLVFFMRGCGRYGEVNKATFSHAKALFSVCNRKDTERLELCATMIQEAATEGQISATEASYLSGIIAKAREDDWTEALAMSRQLMTDQIDM